MGVCLFFSCFSLVVSLISLGFYVYLCFSSNRLFSRCWLLLDNDDRRITALEISVESSRGENDDT